MTPPDTELGPGAQLAIYIAATFSAQFVSRLYGNWKIEAKGEDIKFSTASPDQVKRLDDKVTALQSEVAVIKALVLKEVQSPDDRGPMSKK